MRFICLDPTCEQKFTTPAKRESHYALVHTLDDSDAEDSEPIAAEEEEPESGDPDPVVEAPIIDPWIFDDVPEFETNADLPPKSGGGVTTGTPPPTFAAKVSPTFSQVDLERILRAVFENMAELAGTGPEGQLTDGEARLLANLMLDSANQYFATVAGGNPARAKALVALGVLAAMKSRVYVRAIRNKSKQQTATLAAKVPAQPAPTYGPMADAGIIPIPPGVELHADDASLPDEV